MGSGNENYSQEWLKAINELSLKGIVFVRASRVSHGIVFDDEIFELAERYKKEGYHKNSRISAGKKRKQKAKKKQIKSKQSKKGKQKPEKVSLEDYDADMQKAIRAQIKKRDRRRKLLVILCSVVAVGCFGYFGVYSYYAEKNKMDYTDLAQLKGDSSLTGSLFQGVIIHYTEEEEIELEVLEEYQTLYHKNKRLIGWLKIDDTVIDYPVMQTTNNEYYLDHNFNQEYDKNGSLFLDKDCDVVRRNTNLIIYGHHMKNGSMFATLDHWAEQEYYEGHPVMWLLTPEQDYKIVLFSGYTTSASSDTYAIFDGPCQELDAYLIK